MADVDGAYLPNISEAFDEETPNSARDGWLLSDVSQSFNEEGQISVRDGWYLPDVSQTFNEELRTDIFKDGWYVPDISQTFNEEGRIFVRDGWYVTDISQTFNEESQALARDGWYLRDITQSFDEDFVAGDQPYPGRFGQPRNFAPGVEVQVDPALNVWVNDRRVPSTFTLLEEGYYAITVQKASSPTPLTERAIMFPVCVVDVTTLKVQQGAVQQATVTAASRRLGNRLPSPFGNGGDLSTDDSPSAFFDASFSKAAALTVSFESSSGQKSALGVLIGDKQGTFRSGTFRLPQSKGTLSVQAVVGASPFVIPADAASVAGQATGGSASPSSPVAPAA